MNGAVVVAMFVLLVVLIGAVLIHAYWLWLNFHNMRNIYSLAKSYYQMTESQIKETRSVNAEVKKATTELQTVSDSVRKSSDSHHG